jgi:hypothetical protein
VSQRRVHHYRKCFECKRVARYYDNILPHCRCHECHSADTRKVKVKCDICLDTGAVDSGGFTEDGRPIDVPCECQLNKEAT